MKSLIIYTSITKNTEQVAYTFGSVFEAFGIETTYAKVLPKYKGGEISEYYPEDYDFLCIGCPIIAALPYVNFNSCVGDQEDYKTRNVVFKRRRPISDPDKKRYGIAFTTYGGTGNGPRECIATLEIEKNYLRSYGFTPVGEYACCGKELRHNSVDNLGGQLKMNIPDAQAMMSRYKENPDDEEFKKMDPKLVAIIKKLSSVSDDESFGATLFQENDPLGIGKPSQRFWHYDMQIRPHARDLKKAEYFLTGILEDYLLTADGETRVPGPIYRNIC